MTNSPLHSGAPDIDRRTRARAWPLDAVVFASFEGKGLRARLRFELGLRRIESYVRAATIQVKRIHSALSEYERLPETADDFGRSLRNSQQLLAEAHFYFICWDAVAKALKSLRNNSARLRTPRQVWQRYHKLLEKYQTARDHLEHFTERLPKGKKEQWNYSSDGAAERIAGNVGVVRLVGVFEFHDGQWDVSLNSVEPLTALWTELEDDIRNETEAAFIDWIEGTPHKDARG